MLRSGSKLSNVPRSAAKDRIIE